MTAHHAPAGNSHDHGHDGHSPEKSGSMKGSLYMFLIIVVGIIIMKFLFSSSDGKKENQNNNNTNNTTATERAYPPKPKHVSYGPDYGDIIYLPSGFDYYFEGATEPYCYKNASNQENCGEKGEDATGTFGDSQSNKSLRFKSQNGKHGYLDIILIKK
jgi:hypothetical protein